MGKCHVSGRDFYRLLTPLLRGHKGVVREFIIRNKSDYKKCKGIENEHKLNTILHSVGEYFNLDNQQFTP